MTRIIVTITTEDSEVLECFQTAIPEATANTVQKAAHMVRETLELRYEIEELT